MRGTRIRLWVCSVVVLTFVVAGGWVGFPMAQSQPPGAQQGKQDGALRQQDKATGDEEIESLKRQIEVLRVKVEALSNKEEQHPRERPLVATHPLRASVVDSEQYVGRLHSQGHIKVCPLASGYLQDLNVQEGQAVKKGDVLFTILPTLYQLKLDIERAGLASAQIEFNTTEKLYEKKVISENELALSRAKLAKAQAQAKLAEAEVNSTTVRAPFDGVIGRLSVQAGGFVREGEMLTTLSDNRMMQVYFNVPEVRYLEYMAKRSKDGPGQEEPQIELMLANGNKVNQEGKLAVIESDFQADTGTIAFRADFQNPNLLLRHGQTGTVLFRQVFNDVLVIPQRAAWELDGKRYVYVVGKDDVVQQREIEIQKALDDIFVVEKGLDANDRILVDGIRHVRSGEKVQFEFRKPEELLSHLQKQLKK